MIITVQCPSCETSFPVDTDKVPDGGVNARCSVCPGIFRVDKPAENGATPAVDRGIAEAATEAPATPPAADDVAAPVAGGEPESTSPATSPGETAGAAAAEEDEAAPGAGDEFTAAWEEEAAETPSAPDVGATTEPAAPAIEPRPDRTPSADMGEGLEEIELAPGWEQEIPEAAAEEPGDFELEGAEVELAPGWGDRPSDDPRTAPPAVEGEPAGQEPAAPEAAAPVDEPATSPSLSGDPASAPGAEVVEPDPDAPPADPASGVVPESVPAPAEPPAGFQFGKRDPHEKAQRLARVLVSDMIMYNPERHGRALDGGTLKEDFDDEIRKSWDEYVDQVGSEIAEGTTYFSDALNDILARGEQVFDGNPTA